MKSLFKQLKAIATRNENNEYRYKLGSVKRLAKLRQLQLGILSFFTMASVLVLPNSARAATTTLNFNDTSPIRLSGNALSQGAVYRFRNVTTGVDALVTIAQISNSTLVSLDDNSSFPTRFQPVIKQIGANQTSSIRFNFQLVVSGTTTPTSVPNLYFSSQDTDGNGATNGVREFVEIINSQVTYIPNPTLLVKESPIAGGVRYQITDSSNVQPGIGTDDRYELYSYIGTSVSNFSVIGGSSSGSNTACNSTTNTGCDRQNSYTFNIVDVQPLDFGDAPSTYEPTSYAAHPVPPTPSVFFGATVDGDDAPNYSTNADGDDLAGTDDEDGVTSFPALKTNSTSYSVTASCKGSNIPVAAWIDFNRNGVFDTGERTSGTCNNTSVTLNWTGLTGLSAGKTYARFRIASIASEITSPNTTASNGEVEDYQITIAPVITTISGTVYEDFGASGNNNNTFDNGERTIGNVTVQLFKDDNDDNQPDGAAIKTVETDSTTGAYQFTEVSSGKYLIQVDTRDTDIPSTYAIGTPNPIKINVSADVTNQNFGFNTVSKSCPPGSFLSEQTFLNFQNPTAEPGTTAGQYNIGAVYRFANVAADIDALVEIKALNNATLTQIDINNAGIASGFQPEVKANSTNQGEYSVDFEIRFVQSATTTPVELRKVLATGIDIDGDSGQVREFSELGGNQFTDYAIDSNSNLTATELSATRVKFESKTSFNLNSITINPSNQGSAFYDNNTQTINYRAGLIIDAGDGQSVANQRLTSLIFDCVEYNLAVTTNPNVLLIKRITAVNGSTSTFDGDNLAVYKDEATNPYDDNTVTVTNPNPPTTPADTENWPDPNTFLIGGINGGKVKPDDELEYTIYYLSAGDTEAKSVLFCDRVPGNVSFIPNSFNSETNKATGGLQNADRGIQWLKDGNTESLTNVQDGDVAQYFPPGVEPSTIYPKIKCDGANTNGAIVVNLGNLPSATAPGTPNTSYGFVRFRGRVN